MSEMPTYDKILKHHLMRNELVHNATWEMNPKIFVMVDAGQIIDVVVLPLVI